MQVIAIKIIELSYESLGNDLLSHLFMFSAVISTSYILVGIQDGSKN